MYISQLAHFKITQKEGIKEIVVHSRVAYLEQTPRWVQTDQQTKHERQLTNSDPTMTQSIALWTMGLRWISKQITKNY